LLEQVIIKTRTYADIYYDLLANIKPDVVILLNEISLPDRLMALVCTCAGTPSISIQHGLYIGYVYHKLTTDKVIVWGEEPKKFWETTGCQPERIISVGALAHERWQALKKNELPASPKEKPQILFLGQNPAAFISRETHRKTVSTVFQAAQVLHEYGFIIKPHPAEDIEPYRTAHQGLSANSNVEILTGGAVEDAILRSDLVITVFSTAGLEAMLLEKPVIVLNLSQEPSIAPYTTAAELVESEEALPRSIQAIVKDPIKRQSLISTGKKYADDYFGKMDGLAAQRAVKAIQEIAKS
jgi:UDP-N-acetylglucosamine 2-epimerase